MIGGLWRGLSFLAGRDRGDRDVSRAPNPSAIRHTSAISDQLSVPGTGRRSAARCLSMSFIVPFPFPCTTRCHPTRWIGEILMQTQTHTHTVQESMMNIHAEFEALMLEDRCKYTDVYAAYSAQTCLVIAGCSCKRLQMHLTLAPIRVRGIMCM